MKNKKLKKKLSKYLSKESLCTYNNQSYLCKFYSMEGVGYVLSLIILSLLSIAGIFILKKSFIDNHLKYMADDLILKNAPFALAIIVEILIAVSIFIIYYLMLFYIPNVFYYIFKRIHTSYYSGKFLIKNLNVGESKLQPIKKSDFVISAFLTNIITLIFILAMSYIFKYELPDIIYMQSAVFLAASILQMPYSLFNKCIYYIPTSNGFIGIYEIDK